MNQRSSPQGTSSPPTMATRDVNESERHQSLLPKNIHAQATSPSTDSSSIYIEQDPVADSDIIPAITKLLSEENISDTRAADSAQAKIDDLEPLSKSQSRQDLSSSQVTAAQDLSLPTKQQALHLPEHVEKISPVVVWWQSAFVSHNGPSINNSYFIWYHDEIEIARTYEVLESDMEHNRVTSKGNAQNKSMSELLSMFCQKINLPTPIPDYLFGVIGYMATALFKQHEGARFSSVDLPFGIRGVTQVQREKQLTLLSKKTEGRLVKIQCLGDKVNLHKDEGMLDRGLVNYSVIGTQSEDDFAFIVIANVQDSAWTDNFGTYPSEAFDVALGSASYIFHQSLKHIQNPDNQTEAAILARQIGRSVFEASTKAYVPEEGGTEEAEEAEAEAEVSPAAAGPQEANSKKKKKQNKKRKNKKSKRTQDKAGSEEGEAEAEAEAKAEAKAEAEVEDAVVDSIVPSITVVPPSPDQKKGKEKEKEKAIFVLPCIPASLPLSPFSPSPFGNDNSVAPRSPRIFSFFSSDDRLTCRLPDCTVLANARCASAVICPRCTAYSTTRYCSTSHLLSDLREHFMSGVCGSTLLADVAFDDKAGIPASALSPRRPYVQELQQGPLTKGFTKNILERHRQALYRCVCPPVGLVEGEAEEENIAVDYYIFNDIDQIGDSLPASAPPARRKAALQAVRGTGTVCAVVCLPSTSDLHRKALFNEILDRCLRLGFAAGTICEGDCRFAFDVIRTELRRKGQWDLKQEERVAVQMGFEFGWRLPVEMRG